MTRKDYELIATALHRNAHDLDSYKRAGSSPTMMHEFLCYSVADVLAQDNPRFNRTRFLVACNVEMPGTHKQA